MWEFRTGDIVLWPNGVEGEVCGFDADEGLLMDSCGAWIDTRDVDPIRRGDDTSTYR
jgi:hypothetical protein